jgi:hypothetical protein
MIRLLFVAAVFWGGVYTGWHVNASACRSVHHLNLTWIDC